MTLQIAESTAAGSGPEISTAGRAGRAAAPRAGGVGRPAPAGRPSPSQPTKPRDEGGDESTPRGVLERALAIATGASSALAFASERQALAAAGSVVAPGAHVIVSGDLASGPLAGWIREADQRGIDVTVIEQADGVSIAGALRPSTALVWIALPAEPWRAPIDLRLCLGVTRLAGVPTIVDTTGGDTRQRPLELGAAAIVARASRAWSGADEAGPAIIALRDERLAWQIGAARQASGAWATQSVAAEVLAGLSTLADRRRQQERSARALARGLADNPHVRLVLAGGAPVLPPTLQGPRVVEQAFTSLAIEIRGGPARTAAVAASLRRLAPGPGGGNSAQWSLREAQWPIARGDVSRTARATVLVLSPGLAEPGALLEDVQRALRDTAELARTTPDRVSAA